MAIHDIACQIHLPAQSVACEIEGMGGLGKRVVAIFAQIIHSTRERPPPSAISPAPPSTSMA